MSRLDALTRYLQGTDKSHVRMSFAQIEGLIGGQLPESARRHPAFWSNSTRNGYSKVWRSAGFVASRSGVGPEQVVFTRGTDRSFDGGTVSGPRDRTTVPRPATTAAAVLVGCVATKRPQPMAAKELYDSELFRRRRAYAEASGRPWFIVSGLHGLVDPDEVVEPYERSINDLAGPERAAWARGIADSLIRRLPTVSGQAVEVHAGIENVAALRRPLQALGVQVMTPLSGLRIGEQLQWYDRRAKTLAPEESPRLDAPSPPGRAEAEDLPPPTVSRLVTEITDAFVRKQLDLSERGGAPSGGWSAMPEVAVIERLHQEGLEEAGARRFVTFVAAMDRARDADRLWLLAASLWRSAPWVFDPQAIVEHRVTDLADVLRQSGVSQRHGPDAIAWRLIAESLMDDDAPPHVVAAIEDGTGDARDLLSALQSTTASGTSRFPMLSGPKVGPMWIRMLAVPGGARITSLEVLPVAVDVQVRKVTEYLGVTATADLELEAARGRIQRAWQAGVETGTAVGPPALSGTAAALDPALWFWGKWGCTFCERAGRKIPIGSPCSSCRFPNRGSPRSAR